MKITRIDKISDYHIFGNYAWGSNLPELKRYNLIYGWNGSGKTTLASLLRCIEKRTDVPSGECVISFDNRPIFSKAFALEKSLPQVRVFNREFVEENIFTQTGSVSPIFYLGKQSIEKQKELDSLRATLSERQRELAKQKALKVRAAEDADEFCKDKAKLIKELLSSSGSNTYNRYNKTSFLNKAIELSKIADYKTNILTAEDKAKYRQQKDSSPKDELPVLSLVVPDLRKIIEKVNSLMAKTITSQIIESLKSDANLSVWVESGLKLHDKLQSGNCLFCGNRLPKDLLEKFRGHFNDEYSEFIFELDSKSSEIEKTVENLNTFAFYNKAQVYDHLASEYDDAVRNTKSDLEMIKDNLKILRVGLIEKKKQPFQVMNPILISLPQNADLLKSANAAISKHNSETRNFKSTILQSRTRIEESIVAESLEVFKQKHARIPTFDTQIQELDTEIDTIQKNIAQNERLVVEYRSPADELNSELTSYLGHSDLKFEVQGTGYTITRHGSPARGLSEGEKTAIAFLYFLKFLNDKSFKLKDGIVVIDDPVSSLDANSLFCAFGFMQARVKDAGQLIILTHNFPFFRQIKHWYMNIPKKMANFYMIQTAFIGKERTAQILQLDPLLAKHESEYHYLFKLVFDCVNSNKPDQSLETYYHMPNVARRLLESFLSFKHPKQAGTGFNNLLKETDFDDAKKSKILRFLHTHSHYENIDDPEHDVSVLSETPKILCDVLKLIENADKKHFDDLVELVKPSSTEE